MTSVIRDLLSVAVRHPAKAAAIAYWFATRRRVRARGQLAAAVAALPFVYTRWIEESAARDAAVLADANGRCEIAVHLHFGPINADRANANEAAIASVLAQTWPHWHLVVTHQGGGIPELPNDSRIRVLAEACSSRAAGLKAALETTDTGYLVPLAPECRLPPEALAAYAIEILGPDFGPIDGSSPVLYGDQDEVDANGRRRNPWFKPDWDADMALTQDYVSAACALPVAAARFACGEGGDEAAIYALLLRLAVLGGQEVRHLYRVTASTPEGHWRHASPARIAALQEIAGPSLGFEAEAGVFGTATIRWPLPDALPLVSIVVPTRDRMDLLQPCIEGVLARTRYANFEIVIADNGSVEADTLAFFDRIVADPRVRVVAWPHPYNYSAINNFAVSQAHGAFVCLLNNDTEIIDGEWLGEFMRHACRPGIGAVGARLLYPDRTVQHAGVVVGMGNAAGHAHRGVADGDPGYFGNALIARQATAVTAACLVVSRALFDAVGGLDEEGLRIAYNDVDFCLKLRASGMRNIYTPAAVLIHHESKSRGQDMAPEHRARYLKELATLQERWDTTRFQDPTHHPVLNRSSECYRPGR